MKIKEVRSWSRDLGTNRPYSIAYKTVDEVINALVEVELENGMIGIGAANPSKMVVGVDVEDTIGFLEKEDFGFLIGQDIRHFEDLVKKCRDRYIGKTGCNVAVDIALHDVFTQFLGVPLVDFYGRRHKSMPTSVTIGIKNVEETLAEAKEYSDLKFRILKVKTGLNPEEDAERVIRIHESHPYLMIRVDANQGYSIEDLKSFVKLSKGVPMDLIEQPFPVDRFIEDIEVLEGKAAELLVADESLKDPFDALTILTKTTNCRKFNIKLMKTGGLLSAGEITKIAAWSEVDLMWGCNDESAVSIAAALHLAMSCPHTKYLDLDGSLDLVRDVVSGGFKIEEGVMSITGGAGLGLTRID